MNDHRVLQALWRQDFTTFAQGVCGQLLSAETLQWNWHLTAVCHHLEKVARGETRRLIITLPPRSLKSTLASVALPAFILGHRPSARIVCLSYSAELGGLFARQCRDVMKGDWYRNLFPNTMISRDRDAAHDFFTTKRGHRSTMSVNGSVTGRGGHFVFIDDLMKPDEALSDTRRQSVLQWFDTTVHSRLDEQKTGAIVIVMQRLHVEDLVGHVLGKGGGWEVLNLPAIAETDMSIPIGPNKFHFRKAGDLLHPARDPIEILNQLKVDLGSAVFSAQYQQAPVPAEGNIFKGDWLRSYKEEDLPDPDEPFIQSWDIGMKTNTDSDWSVGTSWIVRNNRYYLVDRERVRLPFPELKRRIARSYGQRPGSTLLIEDMGSGTGLIQQLAEEGIHAIAIRPDKEKVVRAALVTPLFEAGRVFLPSFEPYYDDLRNELLAFPKGVHDDQVDSIVQALTWHQEKIREVPTALFGRY